MQEEFGETTFKTREDLLRYSLPDKFHRFDDLSFLIYHIKRNGYKRILSLGAGDFVLEYLLKMSLPEEIKVVACDFDSFLVEKAGRFFPEITVRQFDFFKNDIKLLQSELNIEFDIAVFFASAYVMDDPEFIKMFSDLKRVGIKQIVDFHAGYMDVKHTIVNYLKTFPTYHTIKKIFRKPPVVAGGGYCGKFHGYSRSRNELRQLYKKSGLKLQQETSRFGSKYIAVLG